MAKNKSKNYDVSLLKSYHPKHSDNYYTFSRSAYNNMHIYATI